MPSVTTASPAAAARRGVMPRAPANPHGLKTRKAKPHEDYRAPSATARDNKQLFGWPRCVYLAYTPGDTNHAELLCGGGQTREEAIACAVGRIERIGVTELETQKRDKKPATPVPPVSTIEDTADA
jgi:hypothetical protein